VGLKTTSKYDARNRLYETTRPDQTRETVGYDADNNPNSTTDNRGSQARTVYDARGRRVMETDALGNQTRFIYDVANQLVAQVDAKGRITEYRYDEVGRQIEVLAADGQRTRTEYDKNGNVLAWVEVLDNGLVNRMEFQYDSRDRQVKVIDANNVTLPIAQQKFTATTYDAGGNVLSIADPLGNQTSYQYDGLNRLITETNQLGKSRRFSYDANGNRVGVTDRNDRTRTFEFDGLNRQTHERWIGVNNTVLRDIASQYDVASRLSRISDADATYTYTYEPGTGRLLTVDNAGTLGSQVRLTYGYDSNGNLSAVSELINNVAGATTTYILYSAKNWTFLND
jgi:YD repeat-containing protein